MYLAKYLRSVTRRSKFFGTESMPKLWLFPDSSLPSLPAEAALLAAFSAVVAAVTAVVVVITASAPVALDATAVAVVVEAAAAVVDVAAAESVVEFEVRY